MLSVVFKNTEISAVKLNCARSTIYNWLSGKTPSLATILKINEEFDIRLTLDYVHNFFSVVSRLKDLEDLKSIDEMIKTSYLVREDKEFLKEYFSKKWWKDEQ